MADKNNYDETQEVAVILPHIKNKVLMQLRDFKPGINFPGHWGFFGGSINEGETPDACAKRELFEEIAYLPEIMRKLSTDVFKLPKAGSCISHSFYCQLTVPIEKIKLKEGLDVALVSLKDILSKEVYSTRMRKYYPVIELPYVANTIRKFLNVTKM